MSVGISEKQRVYNYICLFILGNKYPPTLREIADGTKMSASRVGKMVKLLEKDGRITRKKGKPRTIVIQYSKEKE